jgi:hypothetical protein
MAKDLLNNEISKTIGELAPGKAIIAINYTLCKKYTNNENLEHPFISGSKNFVVNLESKEEDEMNEEIKRRMDKCESLMKGEE